MRPPDLIIGTKDDHYLYRWHLIKTRWLKIYLHKILRSDDERALHDHPWHNISVILKGGYKEIQGIPCGERWYYRRPGNVIFRRATLPHRLVVLNKEPCWSLFITGPTIREWGFHCARGWQHHDKMVEYKDGYSMPKGGCP
jgi:hypothetical protein